MEANFQQWDEERKRKRWEYWAAVRNMRTEYMEEYKGDFSMTRPSLHHWAEEKYGFKMESDGSGNYTETYTISNPNKFILFQLKYWQ